MLICYCFNNHFHKNHVSQISKKCLRPLLENQITPTDLPTETCWNFISNAVGISRRKNFIGDSAGIYRWNNFVGIYRRHRRRREFFLKIATAGWRGFYSDEFTGGNTEGFKPGQPSRDVSLPPAKSTIDLPTEYSVGESVGKRQYILPLPTLSLPLFLCFSFFFPFFFHIPPLPSQTAANHPS